MWIQERRYSNMRKHKHIIVMILLIIAAIIGGYGFFIFMFEHVCLAFLTVFCIVCAFAVEKEV